MEPGYRTPSSAFPQERQGEGSRGCTWLRAKGGDKKNEKEEVYLPSYFRSWKVTLPSSIKILVTDCVRGGDKAEATVAATAAAERREGVGAAEGRAAPWLFRVGPAAPRRLRFAGLLRSRRGCFWEDSLSVTRMNDLGSGAWKADWAVHQAQALVRWSTLWQIVHMESLLGLSLDVCPTDRVGLSG